MSRKVRMATLQIGNTLTVHGQTFFKGRPKVVDNDALYSYLSTHPNFKTSVELVDDNAKQDTILARARDQLRKDGNYVAPVRETTLIPGPAQDADPEETEEAGETGEEAGSAAETADATPTAPKPAGPVRRPAPRKP